MPRITVNLSESGKAWVEQEAEARGCSQSKVVADLVEQARGGESDKTIAERVSELESRVSELESGNITVNQTDSDNRSTVNHSASDERTTVNQGDSENRSTANHSASDERINVNQTESIVDAVRVPGADADEKAARREWLARTIAWVQEKDEFRKADVVARWEEGTLGYDTADGVWESLVFPALEEFQEQGVVEKPHKRAYRWVGED